MTSVLEDSQSRLDLTMGRGYLVHERYSFQEKIGEGSYGVVFKSLDKQTGRTVAVKRIPMKLKDEGVPATAVREVSLLRELSEIPYVVRLLDVIVQESKLLLIFEYLEKDLQGMLKHRATPLLGRKLRRFMFQLLMGLHMCHSRRFVHRDIKPSNILVSRDESVVKIADFGLGRAFRVPLQTYTTEVMTLWYRAPEVLLGDHHYSAAVDVWSMGCVMAELAKGSPLFASDTAIGQLFTIFQVLGTPSDELWRGVGSLPHHNIDFPQWPPASLAAAIPTLDPEGMDLLQQMLTYAPRDRISAYDALRHVWFDDIREEMSVTRAVN